MFVTVASYLGGHGFSLRPDAGYVDWDSASFPQSVYANEEVTITIIIIIIIIIMYISIEEEATYCTNVRTQGNTKGTPKKAWYDGIAVFNNNNNNNGNNNNNNNNRAHVEYENKRSQ